MKIHIVQKGDTLWKLAKKYGVNFEELKSLNSQLSNPDLIMPGMKIKIPVSGKGHTTSKTNTKINMGAKKEVPIVSPVQKKETMKPKEMPIVKHKEIPIVKPKEMPVMPQPIVPEIDINNYYMVNMANMNVQKPIVQPKPEPQPQPVVMKKEQPIKEKVMPKPIAPVVQEQCIPVTPIMPGTGFCPPFFPVYHPFHGHKIHDCMINPLHEEESSSMYEMFHHTHMHPINDQLALHQANPAFMSSNQDCVSQMPVSSVHGLQHHIESSSFFAHESSSSGKMDSSSHYNPYEHHMKQTMMHQAMPDSSIHSAPYVQPAMYSSPIQNKKADCGCGGPKPLGSTSKQTQYIEQTTGSNQSMSHQTMNVQQPMMGQQMYGQQPIGTQQPMMGQQMYGQQPIGTQQPMMGQKMYGQQPIGTQQPMMGQQSYSQQPIGTQQPMMGQQSYSQQPISIQQPMMGQQSYSQQPMGAQQSMMSTYPMSYQQTSMPNQPMYSQQQMKGQSAYTQQPTVSNQPMYGQGVMRNQQFDNQSMVANQPVHGQPHIKTDLSLFPKPVQQFMPPTNDENRPFINQMENIYHGMHQPSTTDALSMPRYADESYG